MTWLFSFYPNDTDKFLLSFLSSVFLCFFFVFSLEWWRRQYGKIIKDKHSIWDSVFFLGVKGPILLNSPIFHMLESCLTLGKWLKLSEPQFPHQLSGQNNTAIGKNKSDTTLDLQLFLCLVMLALHLLRRSAACILKSMRQPSLRLCPLAVHSYRDGASLVAQLVTNPHASAGDTRDMSWIPRLERSPGEGNGSPLQYSCLENSMDRGAWQDRGDSPWGHKESDIAEHPHKHTHRDKDGPAVKNLPVTAGSTGLIPGLEDATCLGAAETPRHKDCSPRTLQPVPCSKRSRCDERPEHQN